MDSTSKTRIRTSKWCSSSPATSSRLDEPFLTPLLAHLRQDRSSPLTDARMTSHMSNDIVKAKSGMEEDCHGVLLKSQWIVVGFFPAGRTVDSS